ncbi:hypothetical protein ABVT39_015887 [Epinephelus coioides]
MADKGAAIYPIHTESPNWKLVCVLFTEEEEDDGEDEEKNANNTRMTRERKERKNDRSQYRSSESEADSDDAVPAAAGPAAVPAAAPAAARPPNFMYMTKVGLHFVMVMVAVRNWSGKAVVETGSLYTDQRTGMQIDVAGGSRMMTREGFSSVQRPLG